MAKPKKLTLVKVGQHYIDPNDVACITKVQSKNLYIVRLKSQPNMEFPIWVNGERIAALLERFDIHVEDGD